MYIALYTDTTDFAEMCTAYTRKEMETLMSIPGLVSPCIDFAYTDKRKNVLWNMAGVVYRLYELSLRFL